MSVVRTPISLKFEDDSSSFYLNLIEPLKENRGLSTFIMDLLKLYYEKEEVRVMFEQFKIENGPLAEIQKQISRIAMSHQKTMNTASMIGDLMSEAENNNGSTTQGNSGNNKVYGDEVVEKVEKLEKTVPQIETKVDRVLEMITAISNQGVGSIPKDLIVENVQQQIPQIAMNTEQNTTINTQQVSIQQSTEQTIQHTQNNQTQSQHIQNQTQESVIPASTYANPEVVPTQQNQGVNNAPQIQTAPIIGNSESTSNADIEQPKSRGNFGKLMGSLKK